jgi:glutathione S-transferase
MVDEQPFVLGGEPSIADFACYHPLWFTRECAKLGSLFDATPSIARWMERIAAFGHGTMTPITAAEAIDAAHRSEPAPLADEKFQDEHGIALGSRVSIVAESFGTEATEGELIAATRTRYSLRRRDARAGTVHVHFPRVGYKLRAATA